jgi:F-box protein 21
MTVRLNQRGRGEEGSITLNHLPDEVLQQILFYCSPRDVLVNIQYTSRRFRILGHEPLLWRHHCRVGFKYWDSKHHIAQKFGGSAADVDWKTLYMHRRRIDKETTDYLDSILEGQTNRISKFKSIAEFGYDAKDTLLRHCRTVSTAHDVLARKQAFSSLVFIKSDDIYRYYAKSVLDHLHRAKALAEWRKVLTGDCVRLERALGAFDLFVLHDQHGDLVEVSDFYSTLDYGRIS